MENKSVYEYAKMFIRSMQLQNNNNVQHMQNYIRDVASDLIRNGDTALVQAEKISELKDKLHRRNMQIDYLKKRIEELEKRRNAVKQSMKDNHAIDAQGNDYIVDIQRNKELRDNDYLLISQQNEVLKALRIAEGKLDVEQTVKS